MYRCRKFLSLAFPSLTFPDEVSFCVGDPRCGRCATQIACIVHLVLACHVRVQSDCDYLSARCGEDSERFHCTPHVVDVRCVEMQHRGHRARDDLVPCHVGSRSHVLLMLSKRVMSLYPRRAIPFELLWVYTQRVFKPCFCGTSRLHGVDLPATFGSCFVGAVRAGSLAYVLSLLSHVRCASPLAAPILSSATSCLAWVEQRARGVPAASPPVGCVVSLT